MLEAGSSNEQRKNRCKKLTFWPIKIKDRFTLAHDELCSALDERTELMRLMLVCKHCDEQQTENQ